MNLAIVDDQKEYHQIIKRYLKQIKEYEFKITCFTSIEELEKSNISFNLILLDIDMPDINGVDYAKEHLNLNIVFVTNHSIYMKHAYGPNIYGFIEKSDSVKEFVSEIKEVLSYFSKQHMVNIKTETGDYSLFEKDIIYIQYLDRKKLCIKQIDDEYVVNGHGLKDFHTRLSSDFMFCSRDTIVNIKHIVGITTDNKIILKGIKTKHSISARRLSQIKQAYYNEVSKWY